MNNKEVAVLAGDQSQIFGLDVYKLGQLVIWPGLQPHHVWYSLPSL